MKKNIKRSKTNTPFWRDILTLIVFALSMAPNTYAQNCTFNTPLPNALPNINTAFQNIYVLGTGGPNLDNITIFTINWDLNNNGLYQFSINTNNGTPNWYVDLRSSLTHSFNTAQPDATFSGTGIAGLDGDYWVTIDAGNFVMVSKTGGFTLYFSALPTAPDCGSTSNVDGGVITGGPFNFTVGDNIDDFATGIGLSGNIGQSSQWIITDGINNILALPTSPDLVNFDTQSPGTALIWHLSYNGTVGGVTVGNNTSAITGDFDLSNSISVTKTDPNGCPNCPPIDNLYIDRFIEIRNEFYDPANGYFSADGSPHHSIETLIVEAPDYGHESTSELYSYWLWLEAMNGRITKNWTPLANVWNAIEQFIIPTNADQPTNSAYNPANPAAYASEFPLPNDYPAPLDFSAPVGEDPVSADLTATYGADVYQMHWLLDNDNFYGYGNRGDGISTPSYINTFQRGEQESVFETIPHPSWENFNWGGPNGFLPLFTIDQNYSRQWRYTSAPDADARAVQAMYWALQYAKEQQTPISVNLLNKATKMGDYLRLAMFDKYFKPLGVQSATSGAGQGYNSAHYLMSWYISWGGAVDTTAPWAFRISSSHCHFGYQNPMAAYALTQVNELKPTSQNGVTDWTESLKRQMEFYTWLQSKEGAIAGGATNSWNGNYSTYPAGKSTFYNMAYDDNPVYHDPGSGTWFGWQAWSMERVAEYYYITNDAMAKALMDKWATWVKSVVQLVGTDDFLIPATLAWTGEPDTWDPVNPGANNNLSVTVTDYGKDLGVAASMAKALIYYAAATEKHATIDAASRDLAKEILDRMWAKYRDTKGLSSPETRSDFTRIFDQTVYVPNGFTGTMANGDQIAPGVSFLDIRSKYQNDPEYNNLLAAYNSGQGYTQNYHRSWAQIEIALANAEYGFFFGGTTPPSTAKVHEKHQQEKQLAQENVIKLSPNPTNDIITLSGSIDLQNSRVKIINLSGRVIKSFTIENAQKEKAISLKGLQSGVYILNVRNTKTGAVLNKKIVKNNF
ncbi:glycoside hydrolase family 48 protein [Flavivirga eckloniae]|uniref:Secretion system C-terminal sorting domain-containing protein n=1 Tax=Flavivirga eckloniae TaxID=1803846 RepID=A0A2K9PLB8_9FLAO|nr:glycoside hydrolase family 48 protein [Flavivirga eckloniae]AUP77377.1 hypothetical protein C1H87_01035 [Flavivirga eckloniae]